MRNTEIFNDYDMVVSYTQELINEQLVHLARAGVINTELIIVEKHVEKEYTYRETGKTIEYETNEYDFPGPDDPIPDNCQYIKSRFYPQILISKSGTDITFVLNFLGGTANFYDGPYPPGKLVKYNMKDWKYGVNVPLALKKIEKNDIQNKIKVPKRIEDQLHYFIDNMFRIDHLFLDFQSTNLIDYDPNQTYAKDSGESGPGKKIDLRGQLCEFMEFYLLNLSKEGNPYILGYSVNTSDDSQFKPDQFVPDSLKPTGTTFTLFHYPEDPKKNNLNFILATKGGKGTIKGSPDTFGTNWFSDNDTVKAKMIISRSDLIEKIVLKPFFDNLRNGVYRKIHKNISISENNNYNDARKVNETGTMIDFTISNVTSGNDRYVNTFSVAKNASGQTKLDLSGHLYFRKEVHKKIHLVFKNPTAKAHAEGTIDWTATISITTEKNEKGNPALKLNLSFDIKDSYHSSGKNHWANALSWMGDILGRILDAFTGFTDDGAMEKMLLKAFSVEIPKIGNIEDEFNNLSNAIGGFIILPAGDVFFFKDPSLDQEMNFYLDLTYLSEND